MPVTWPELGLPPINLWSVPKQLEKPMPSITRDHLAAKMIVAYPTKEAQQVITDAEYRLIRNLDIQKVQAIKFIREQYNLGLYEAKMIVDTVRQQPSVTHS